MFIGDVGGVGGNDNAKWNKRLAEELDAADGKKDGKIDQSVWNGFLESTGSKGNRISNFINLNNAEKSFAFYDSKKDVGNVDWKDWQNLLNVYLEKSGKSGSTEKSDEKAPTPPADESKPKSEVEQIQQEQAELDEALKKSPLADVKSMDDFSKIDKSKFTLVEDRGPGASRFVNPETNESILLEIDNSGKNATITYSNGDVVHTIKIADGKDVEGKIETKQADGSVKSQEYVQSAEGKAIPKSLVKNPEERPELTQTQKDEFVAKSPLKDIKSANDFDKLDLSKYEWNLMNYQGTGYYINKETGERIDVERSFGVGGYKNLSVSYTKDGITQKIKFDESGNITSNEIKNAPDLPTVPVLPDKSKPATQEELQSAVEQLPIGQKTIPTDEELQKAGFVKSEKTITMNGGYLYTNDETGESIILTTSDRTIEYRKGDVRISQFYDENGKATSGYISVKGEKGAFAIGDYKNDPVTGKADVKLTKSHEAPTSNTMLASEGAEAFSEAIAEFQTALGFPADMNVDIPALPDPMDGYHNERSTPDGFKRDLNVDKDGNVSITYSKQQADGSYKELGTLKLQLEQDEGSLRGYNYSFHVHNNITGYDTTISSGLYDV